MKKAAIISCNDNYDYDTRTKYVGDYLKKQGFETVFIIADFDHRNKTKYHVKSDRTDKIVYIHVKEYTRNFSLGRILSHIIFAKKVKKHVEQEKYDLIYHCAPPNSTIKALSGVKKEQGFKLITEIGDMWPETMPVSQKVKRLLFIPFGLWASLRDKYLFNSELVIAECNLFRNQLVNRTGLNNIQTVYFCKESNFVTNNNHCASEVNLCYLGSINNIIDCTIIGKLVEEIVKYKKVQVHIIGDGENRELLIDTIKQAGGLVWFYGKVFDDEKKKQIFSKCDYALNIMKTSVNVGMTMKSLDYFSFGLPIINNIGGDIQKMVQDDIIGFNICDDNIRDVAASIVNLKSEDYEAIKKNIRLAHEKYFSINAFIKCIEKMI